MKPGYLTTEFWLTLLAILAGVIVLLGADPAEAARWQDIIGQLIVLILPVLTYTAGRIWLKK